MGIIRKYSFIFICILIPAIGLLFYNSGANFHYHRLDNGILTSHAHPYEPNQSSPIQNHQHTSFEFDLLEHIGLLFFFLLTTAACINLIHSPQKIVWENEIHGKNIKRAYYTIPQRGPPSNKA